MRTVRVFIFLFSVVALVFISLYLQGSYVSQVFPCVTPGMPPTFSACWKEVIVRIPLHLVGSVIVILLLQFAKSFLGLNAIAILVGVIIFYFGFQEFYAQSAVYGQPLFKGAIDFVSWTTPLVFYILIQYKHVLSKKH